MYKYVNHTFFTDMYIYIFANYKDEIEQRIILYDNLSKYYIEVPLLKLIFGPMGSKVWEIAKENISTCLSHSMWNNI